MPTTDHLPPDRMACWLPAPPMAEQVKWSVAYEAAKMEKGEELMQSFGWIEKIAGSCLLYTSDAADE